MEKSSLEFLIEKLYKLLYFEKQLNRLLSIHEKQIRIFL